jgi:hypothetical protein
VIRLALTILAGTQGQLTRLRDGAQVHLRSFAGAPG